MNEKSLAISRVHAAELTPSQLNAVRHLEEAFDNNFYLLAVHPQTLFVLEAKSAPNHWQNILDVYPQDELPSWYLSREEAFSAKAALKTLLHGKWKNLFEKYPIRVRRIDDRDCPKKRSE